MRIFRFASRRLLFLIPQVLGIVTITFFLLRLLPGNPAQLIAGVAANPQTIAAIEARLGLDKPLYVQYFIYLENLLKGDLGDSWVTGQPVTQDILTRLPATLELITISLILSLLIGIPLGVLVVLRPRGIVDRFTFGYGLLAGALPDFWLGLLLVFVLFFILRLAPAPLGRLGLIESPPTMITGMYTVDSLLTGNWKTFQSAVAHLALPVLTLVFVYMGGIVKMTRSAMEEMLNSDFVEYARASGLSQFQVLRYALRNSLPPIVTIIGIMYGFLLGGAVLVEKIFSWGGMGQYAVQSVVQADYAPIQGFVLIAAVFNMIIYLILDLVYVTIDPRLNE
jgi:peptide/nickel transport system permease protein